MSIQTKTDSLILDIYQHLPSLGESPFTVVRMDSNSLNVEVKESELISYLLVLARTDFSSEDLVDYIKNSREYESIAPENREQFLGAYLREKEDEAVFQQWRERVISMGLGILSHLARKHGLIIKSIDNKLVNSEHTELYRSNCLIPYQLFEILDLKDDIIHINK